MKTGCGLHTDDIPRYRPDLWRLQTLDLENFLFSGFADQAEERLPEICRSLQGYPGELLVSGPYVDLNPGSPERLVTAACQERFTQAHRFATALGAGEMVFCSTFLPIIRLPAYEEDWVRRSVAFWRTFLDQAGCRVRISLANTFESDPSRLVQVAAGVDNPAFGLTFDLGHYLVYGQTPLESWLHAVAPYCQTVYVHSNDGAVDQHLPPQQGVLQGQQLQTAARCLPAGTRFVAKMNDKAGLRSSLDWIEAALAGSGTA
jgi:sugar phosphate isomerase/epimerase